MTKRIDLDNILFILLLTSFVVANSLIHITTAAIILRSFYIFFINKEKLIILNRVPKPILYGLASFVVFASITNILKIEKNDIMISSFREYKWIFVLLFYIFFLSNRFKRKWLSHASVLLVVSSLVALYSIAQFFIGFDLFGGHREFLGHTFPFRAIGLFGIPITFSYMIGGIFFLIIPHIYANFASFSKSNKVLIFLTLGLMFLNVLVTQTRISWLAFYIVFFMLSLFYLKKMRIFAFISILLVPTVYFLAPKNLQSRITSVLDTKVDGANKGRIYIWRAHLSLFGENPVLGNGISNYEKYVENFYEKNGIVETPISHAHNTFLHVLSSQGVLGFIPFLVFYFYFLFLAFKNTYIKDPFYRVVSIGVLASLLFLYIGGLTEVVITDSETIHLLSFLWSITICLHAKKFSQLSAKS